jgi:DNA-binding response OmpR family regulator
MGKTILLVEDETMIREMYDLVLKQKGYTVIQAEDGEVALKYLLSSDTHIDLVLLDVMIPKVDGLNVLKQMKAQSSPTKDVPVFLLTNLGQEDLITEAITVGAIKYLIKSNMIPKQLVEEIDNFFQKSQTA